MSPSFLPSSLRLLLRSAMLGLLSISLLSAQEDIEPEPPSSAPPAPLGARKAIVDPASIHDLHQVPSSYRYSGEYVLQQRTKASALEQIPTPTSALRYHVFTDGEEVRIYLATVPREFSAFQIYRRDGIQILKNQGQTQELVPGVQATTLTGDKLRHLCLARDFFQLTEFPGNSDQLIILRATRVGRNPVK